jgi:pSer/pThr/pTyr-binding forkhead associated (FHA) protein
VIHDGSVSRNHAGLRLLEDGSVVITDLDSKNGTFLGEEKVPAEWHGEPLSVPPRGNVKVGSVSLKLLDADGFIDFVSAFVGPIR